MIFDLIETKRKPVYDVLRCLARDTDNSFTIPHLNRFFSSLFQGVFDLLVFFAWLLYTPVFVLRHFPISY